MLIRRAEPKDLPAMARVNVDTKRSMYADFYPKALLEILSYERVERSWQNLWDEPSTNRKVALVAEREGGEIVGILIGGPENEGDLEYQAEIYVLYVLPVCHYQGVGRALVAEAARILLDQGKKSLLIWVLDQNPSCRFYEALGGKPVRSRMLDLGSYRLAERGYGWADMHLLLERKVECGDA